VVRRAGGPRAGRCARRARALDTAAGGAVEEGQIGAGVGMETFGYAGGIGTSSRVVGEHTVGVLVLSNFGLTERFVLCGRPVGRELAGETASSGEGSCICLVATDAPLLPHQLRRLARRPFLGLGNTGSYGSHGSGEISFAWTTANLMARDERADVRELQMLRDDLLSLLFAACVEAAEEAVLNALCAGRDLRSYDGTTLPRFPAERFSSA
jgi:D-aminopeptidase